jgi:nitronate monooxygenase
MNLEKMPTLKIGELEAKIPIIQGGMGVGVSLSGLASAVAKEGGIGVIATAGIGMHEPDINTNLMAANNRALRKEIRKAREITNGIIGVNIMMALTDFNELVLTAVDEGVDLVFVGAGLPLKNPESLPLDRIKFIPIVSSARAAKIIFEYWSRNYNYVPNAVVVEGPMAGGHLGFKIEQINDPDYKLEKILPEVIAVTKIYGQQYNKDISVIAAGGIFTGADIHKFIQLGAHGVQMATRFVATHECDTSIKFKEMYVNCKEEDIIIIESPVGLPGRAIRNQFLDAVTAGQKQPFRCPWTCLRTCDYNNVPYCIALALINAKKGKLNDGFAFAGANAYKVDKIVSVKELIDTLIEEYEIAVSV